MVLARRLFDVIMAIIKLAHSETKNGVAIKDAAVITIYMVTAWLELFCCRTDWSLDCQRNVTNNAFMIISITSRVETLALIDSLKSGCRKVA
jgi:hypothetical protein